MTITPKTSRTTLVNPGTPSPAVLVVEDDVDIRLILHIALEDVGYRVIEVPDGLSALEHLQSSPTPLVVLLDWWLPGADGL